jgi:hypothetical protein
LAASASGIASIVGSRKLKALNSLKRVFLIEVSGCIGLTLDPFSPYRIQYLLFSQNFFLQIMGLVEKFSYKNLLKIS